MVKREPLKKRDFIKIAGIFAVIVIPILISFYAVNRELPPEQTFWHTWDCPKILEYKNHPDFDRMTEIVKSQFLQDYEKCIIKTPEK